MNLSSNLISQFVKATKDNTNVDTETTVNGTTVEYSGKMYVKLDGSDLLTPISTTADVKEGERVTVTIKNHTATVTGNFSSPAARTDDVLDVSSKVTLVETLLADKVNTEQLTAINADIENLKVNKLDASDANITYATIENLTATNAEVEKLNVNKLDASEANITYATIESLNATNAEIANLDATFATIDKLESTYATIESLNATNAKIENLDATFATIESLEASNANIETLQAGVASIDTLIYGSASGTSIHSDFANAVIAQLGEAQIKSAMIDTVSASKINAGSINTNNVKIESEDGHLVISDNTIQISDDNCVRVQIGKDASGDYSITICDADGKVMFSEGGITDNAIKQAIIRNDMVASDANIDAKKLDISSLFTEINGSTQTISSSKVLIDSDNQTLDIAFTKMSSDVDDISADVSSQGTSILAIQGKIESKIWQEDIDSANFNGRNLLLNTHDEQTIKATSISFGISAVGAEKIKNGAVVVISFDIKADSDTVIDTYPRYITSSGTEKGLTEIGQILSITSEWSRCSAVFDLSARNYNKWTIRSNKNVTGGSDARTVVVKNVKLELGNTASSWTPAPEDIGNEVENLTTRYSTLTQTVDGLSSTVGQHTTEIANKADGSAVTEVSDKVSQLEQTVDSFKTTVSATYATKEDVDTTYITKEEFDDIEFNGRNLLLDSMSEVAIKSTLSTYNISPNGITKLSSGAIVAISFDAKASSDTNIDSYPRYINASGEDAAYTSNRPTFSITTEWNKYSAVIELPNLDYKQYTIRSNSSVNGGNSKVTVYIKNVKLELGDTATDWTAAPEDISNLVSRVTTAETSISQNSEYIALAATKSELETFKSETDEEFKNYYTKEETDAQILIKSDSITSTVSQTYATKEEVSNIEIGGRNLIRNSKNLIFDDYYFGLKNGFRKVEYIETTGTQYIDTGFVPNQDSRIITRFKYKSGSNIYGSRKNASSATNANDNFALRVISSNWQPCYGTTLGSSGVPYDTEWHTADQNSNIFKLDDVVLYEFEYQTFKAPRALMLSAINASSGGIYTGKNYIGETQLYDKKESGDIVLERNLIPCRGDDGKAGMYDTVYDTFYGNAATDNTDVFLYGADININSLETSNVDSPYGTTDDCSKFTVEDLVECYVLHGVTITDQEYTLSFWIRADENGSVLFDGESFEVSTEWTKYSHTFTADSNNVILQFGSQGTYYIYHPQLELGNKATDWTPAPEDLDEGISSAQDTANQASDAATEANASIVIAQSLIQQLSNSISMLVVDENGESLMTQTGDRWSFSMKETSDTVSELSKLLDDLAEKAGGTEAAVNILNDTLADHSNTLSYVNITTYINQYDDEEPCIELGKSDSEFRLMITNTSIMFKHGSDVPTYIDTNGLVTQNITVKNEIRHGGYSMITLDDGSWGLLWVGRELEGWID